MTDQPCRAGRPIRVYTEPDTVAGELTLTGDAALQLLEAMYGPPVDGGYRWTFPAAMPTLAIHIDGARLVDNISQLHTQEGPKLTVQIRAAAATIEKATP